MRARFALALVVLVASTFAMSPASGDKPPYDMSFGKGGLSSVGFRPPFRYAEASDVAVRADGTILMVGTAYKGGATQFAVSVLSRGGAPVRGFSKDGRVTTRFGRTKAFASAVLPWRNGKILAAGVAGADLALARYTREGVLDPTFGRDGKVVTKVCTADCSVDELVDGPNGTATLTGAIGRRPALIRYLANGRVDRDFGADGLWLGVDSFGGETIYSVVLLPDDKVLAVGAIHGEESGRAVLARYNADGTLDATFGTGGRVVTAFIPDNHARAHEAVVLGDGDIVVAGTASPGGDYTSFAVARYDASGTLDPSFGGDGIVTTSIGDYYSRINDLAVLEDGRIFVFGESAGGGWRITAAMYKDNGSLDKGFAGDGTLVTPFPRDAYGGFGFSLVVDGNRGLGVGTANGDFAAVAYSLAP